MFVLDQQGVFPLDHGILPGFDDIFARPFDPSSQSLEFGLGLLNLEGIGFLQFLGGRHTSILSESIPGLWALHFISYQRDLASDNANNRI